LPEIAVEIITFIGIIAHSLPHAAGIDTIATAVNRRPEKLETQASFLAPERGLFVLRLLPDCVGLADVFQLLRVWKTDCPYFFGLLVCNYLPCPCVKIAEYSVQ